MFLKAFRVKSSTQMKGSDKKKFKSELRKRFPSLSDENLDFLIPAKEEILVRKIYTFGGESVLLYIHQKKPLFFETDLLLFPTVYTLWIYPDLLKSFPTWPPVLKKIANGADLMLPGVVVDREELGMKAYGNLVKGEPLAVNLTTNLAAVAVGKAALSSEDMYMAGGRGKAINILHFYGDELWSSGTREELPELGPPGNLEFLSREDRDEDANEDVEDDDDVEERNQEGSEEEKESLGNKEEANDVVEVLEKLEEIEIDDRSPSEKMDELLREAFLSAWKTSAKNAELPMLTSNFFRLHMVPAVKPEVLDVKKSSFKKLSKFLAEQQKRGIIKVKELQKGVDSIVEVNLNHEEILFHRITKREQEKKKKTENEDESETAVLPCDKPYEPPVIIEVHTTSAAVAPLFKGFPKGSGLTTSEVRTFVTDYVTKEGLVNEEDKRFVNLNPVLAGIVLRAGENDVVKMKWEDLLSRIRSKMSDGYSMQFPGGPKTFHKGKLTPIELSVVTRSGNKKVTLVHNLDVFKIDPDEFAHKCRLGVAASTSVNMNPANRKSGTEVLVQGNQVAFISKLLLNTYKVNKKYILGMEKAIKQKGANKR